MVLGKRPWASNPLEGMRVKPTTWTLGDDIHLGAEALTWWMEAGVP
jgi:hypothetical protein